jgi:two-component system sensor histidine kinase HydH
MPNNPPEEEEYGRSAARNEEFHEDLMRAANAGAILLSCAHDAKNALNNLNALISALIHLLPKHTRDTTPGSEILASLATDTRYLRYLMSVITSVARGRQSPIYRIDIKDLLKQATELLDISFRNVTVSVDGEEKLMVSGRPGDLLQLFVNLIQNSLQAIRTRGRGTGRISIKVYRQASGQVEILVHDNGVGISPELLPHVFEPGVTTKHGLASGIGLALCRRIVEEHGGTISLTSRGSGTLAKVSLPEATSA